MSKTLRDRTKYLTTYVVLGAGLLASGAGCSGGGGGTEGTGTEGSSTGTTAASTSTTTSTSTGTGTTTGPATTTGPTTATGSTTMGMTNTGTGDTGTGDTGTGDTGTGDTGTAGGTTGGATGTTAATTGTTGGGSTGTTGGTTGGGIPTCNAAMFEDFAMCPGSFTVGKASTDPGVADPTWECGDPMSGPMGAMGVWATNLAGDYDTDESAYLEAPPLDLTGCEGKSIEVVVNHWYDFEGLALGQHWDGGNFQVSTDGGMTWQVVPALGHWYDTNSISASFVPPDGQPGFTGDDRMWRESIVDLSAYAGLPDVRFRIVMGSDSVVTREGWYIDDYEVLVQ